MSGLFISLVTFCSIVLMGGICLAEVYPEEHFELSLNQEVEVPDSPHILEESFGLMSQSSDNKLGGSSVISERDTHANGLDDSRLKETEGNIPNSEYVSELHNKITSLTPTAEEEVHEKLKVNHSNKIHSNSSDYEKRLLKIQHYFPNLHDFDLAKKQSTISLEICSRNDRCMLTDKDNTSMIGLELTKMDLERELLSATVNLNIAIGPNEKFSVSEESFISKSHPSTEHFKDTTISEVFRESKEDEGRASVMTFGKSALNEQQVATRYFNELSTNSENDKISTSDGDSASTSLGLYLVEKNSEGSLKDAPTSKESLLLNYTTSSDFDVVSQPEEPVHIENNPAVSLDLVTVPEGSLLVETNASITPLKDTSMSMQPALSEFVEYNDLLPTNQTENLFESDVISILKEPLHSENNSSVYLHEILASEESILLKNNLETTSLGEISIFQQAGMPHIVYSSLIPINQTPNLSQSDEIPTSKESLQIGSNSTFSVSEKTSYVKNNSSTSQFEVTASEESLMIANNSSMYYYDYFSQTEDFFEGEEDYNFLTGANKSQDAISLPDSSTTKENLYPTLPDKNTSELNSTALSIFSKNINFGYPSDQEKPNDTDSSMEKFENKPDVNGEGMKLKNGSKENETSGMINDETDNETEDSMKLNLSGIIYLLNIDQNLRAFMLNKAILYFPVLVCDVLLWMVILKLIRHFSKKMAETEYDDPEQLEAELEAFIKACGDAQDSPNRESYYNRMDYLFHHPKSNHDGNGSGEGNSEVDSQATSIRPWHPPN